MQPGTVSVVIPAYNAAAFLPQAIASAMGQTRRPAEVIVVDDCSTDESVAVAAACGARVIRQPVNGGPGAARNTGIREAAGAYVALLDADDYWEPHHCETVAGLLDEHPTAGLASARARYLPPGSGDSAAGAVPNTPLHVLVQLFRSNLVVQTTAVARRAVLLAAGGYDPSLRYAEDYDLWLRIARTEPLIFSHAVTARYRAHPQQATKDIVKLTVGEWSVRHRHFEWLTQHGDPSTVSAAAAELRRALDAELHWAWYTRAFASMEIMFRAGAWVPEAARITQRWKGRLGATEPFWRAAESVRRTVSQLVRR